MSDNEKQSSNNARKTKKVNWLVFVGLLVVVPFFGYNSFLFGQRVLSASQKKDDLYSKLATLRERKANVQAEIDKIQKPEGKEDILKNDLGSYKNDEHVIIFVDSKNKEAN